MAIKFIPTSVATGDKWSKEEIEHVAQVAPSAPLQMNRLPPMVPLEKRPVGRPSQGKERVHLWLKSETLAKFKATGKGWQSRISDILDAAKP